jgi:hypothetical protein
LAPESSESREIVITKCSFILQFEARIGFKHIIDKKSRISSLAIVVNIQYKTICCFTLSLDISSLISVNSDSNLKRLAQNINNMEQDDATGLVRAKGASRLKGLSIIANSIVIIANIAKDSAVSLPARLISDLLLVESIPGTEKCLLTIYS